MKRLLVNATLIALTVAGQANALITIIGAPNCADWVGARRANASQAYEAWMVGFLNGLAVGRVTDFTRTLSLEQIYLWTDNYCTANPLETVPQAGIVLADELTKRTGAKPQR